MKKKIILIIIGIIITILQIIFIIIPYAKVEILTLQHKDEFPNVEEDVVMIGEIEYIKVMEYDDEKAEVFAVATGHDVTVLCHYEYISNEWQLDYWECIWSSTGSADSLIWPFYR